MTFGESLLLLGVAAVATQVWRVLGVAMAVRMRPDWPLLDWVGCCAYAILAGLIARMLVLPAGPLEATSLAQRGIATAVGVAVFILLGRRVLPAVVAGTAVLSLLVAAGLP